MDPDPCWRRRAPETPTIALPNHLLALALERTPLA